MNSTDLRKFEDEVRDSLDLDDADVLARRVSYHEKYMSLFGARSRINHCHSRSQWTRVHDGVQEHFNSHILINNQSHRLPANIYALKQNSKQSWMLYKKRECERRKRLRIKIEKEREIEKNGGPANILLSMVDACEVCKKLFVTVNLFWGVTICDLCYFNEEVIKDIMKKRKNLMVDMDSSNPFKLDTHTPVESKSNTNEMFFTIQKREEKIKPIILEDSPEVIPRGQEEIEIFVDDISLDAKPEEDDDIRTISTYKTPATPPTSPFCLEKEEEEVIHEELENGEWVDEDDVCERRISFNYYSDNGCDFE